MNLKRLITLIICLIVAILSVVLGVVSVNSCKLSSLSVLEQQFSERTNLASEYIESSLDFYKKIVTDIGQNPTLASPTATVAEKEAVIAVCALWRSQMRFRTAALRCITAAH